MTKGDRKGSIAPTLRIVEGADGSRKIYTTRRYMNRLVAEEVARLMGEAEGDDEEKPRKKSKGPSAPAVVDADSTPTPKQSPKDGPAADPQPDASEQPEEVPDTEDPADDAIAGQEDEVEPSKLASEITGKTLQSVTQEPKSKIVPGAQELVLTFNEITDQLRVIVTKTGQVRFYFRNSLYNMI
jgi:hypothetical protein